MTSRHPSRHRLKRSFNSGKCLDENFQGVRTIADHSASSAKFTGDPNSNPNQDALTYDQAYAKSATLWHVWGSNTTASDIAQDDFRRLVAYLEILRGVQPYLHPQILERDDFNALVHNSLCLALDTLLRKIDLGKPLTGGSAITSCWNQASLLNSIGLGKSKSIKDKRIIARLKLQRIVDEANTACGFADASETIEDLRIGKPAVRWISGTDFTRTLLGSGRKDGGATSNRAYDADLSSIFAMGCQLLISHISTAVIDSKRDIVCIGKPSPLDDTVSWALGCCKNVNATDEGIGSAKTIAQVTRLPQRRSTIQQVYKSLFPLAKPSLPALLIEIRPDPFRTDRYVAKLIVPTPSVKQYICLSYLWNPSTFFGTTTTTLRQFVHDILNLLCILQDSNEDISCELAKVDSIYANTSLTLIASESISEEVTYFTHNLQYVSRTSASSRKDADADIHVHQAFEHPNLDSANPDTMSVPPLLNEENLPSQLVDTEDDIVDAGESSHANLCFDQPYPPRAEFTDATNTGISAINRVDTWLEETESGDIERLYPYVRELLDDLLEEYIEGAAEDVVQEGAQYDTPSDTSSSSMGSSTKSDSGLASSSRNRLQKRGREGSSQAERCGGQEEDNGDCSDYEDERPKPKKGRGSPCVSSQKRLRCPFFLNNPEQYGSGAACSGGKGFPDMSKLMQHLTRCHVQPQRCARCRKEIGGPQLEAHLRVDGEDLCEILPEPADDRISQVRWAELRSKAPDYRNKTVEEKWRSLYKALFPGDERVPSPYARPAMFHQLEPYLVEVMHERLLQRFGPELQEMIPAIVQESEQRFQRASANTSPEIIDRPRERTDAAPVFVPREGTRGTEAIVSPSIPLATTKRSLASQAKEKDPASTIAPTAVVRGVGVSGFSQPAIHARLQPVGLQAGQSDSNMFPPASSHQVPEISGEALDALFGASSHETETVPYLDTFREDFGFGDLVGWDMGPFGTFPEFSEDEAERPDMFEPM